MMVTEDGTASLSRIAHGCRGDRGQGRGTMLCSQKNNELRDLILGKGILERWHLLTTILNLVGNLRGLHELAHAVQRRSFGRALGVDAVAVRAPLVAEERSSGLRIFFL